MLAKETIDEMVRIIRDAKRMCDAHDHCVECVAAGINCNINDADNKNLAKLIQIVDAWSMEHSENEEVDG